MRVLEAVDAMRIDGPFVWVAGDWHGNTAWMQAVMPALRRNHPHVKTMLHVGDWWMKPDPVDYWARTAGIERILVTLGNHEPWPEYTTLLNEHPGCAVRVSQVIWLLPRPWRFEIAGRVFLSLGGAASADRLWRQAGKDWWSEERILDEHVEAASVAPADVMITHETPNLTPVKEVQEILAGNPQGFPQEALDESAASRAQVDRVWNEVKPALLFHGHMHVFGDGTAADGRRVVSLGRDALDGNIALLDASMLEVAPLPLTAIRGW